ncbi:MAG: C45 family autoproteolytic acyltransferase/hydrolase [Actinobacteria bacterium]|nr:C45 family autoproteolytic acyltransferase/hydrolase [Actinomycetota bacterium]
MFGGSLRVLEIFGDSADLGRGHGAACAGMIGKYLDDRIELTVQEEWSGGSPDRDLILEIAEGTLEHHERFAEELYVEMVAMADAAGITPAEAVVVGGFTDLVDVVRSVVGTAPLEHNCTAILNPEAGFLAQTWDMHASAGEFVIMLKLDPIAGPNVIVQTTAGCLGQMGMNEAGISIGINNLTSLGKPGVTWPFVVRRVLEQTDLDSAVEVVTGAELAGGHNFLLMGPDGDAVNIEAMPGGQQVTRTSDTAFVHTNHCLGERTAESEGERLPEHVESSNTRLNVAAELADDPEAFFAEALICRRVDDPHDVGTCGAVMIEPRKRRMKAVWGIPGDHPWETFQL